MIRRQYGTSPSLLLETLGQLECHVCDHWLEPLFDILAGKEWLQWLSSLAVKLMGYGEANGASCQASALEPSAKMGFNPTAWAWAADVGVKVGVIDRDFPGVDSDDGAYLRDQRLNCDIENG